MKISRYPHNRIRAILLLLALCIWLSAGCGQKEPPAEADPVPAETPQPTAEETCDALFYGDSVTAGNNFDEFFPELTIVDFGINGATIQDLTARAEEVGARRPDRIFVMAGGNNLNADNVDQCAELFRGLLDALIKACPNAQIFVESMLPLDKATAYAWNCPNRTIRMFNEQLKAIAAEYGLTYLDIYPSYEKAGGLDSRWSRDGIHLNDDAFGPWAEVLRPYLEP